jgi:ribonuclease E
MTMRMLIDARHREETRVAVVQGNRIEEFDFESAEHKQLKGNIYLAKVTRVEPSLQAAFVDYGGNRHGFLAFSEIHPDYYQIPREDREALLREEAEHAAEEAALRADDDDDDHSGSIEEVERPNLDDEDEDGEEGGEAAASGDRSGGREGGNGEQADELRRKRMALRRRYKIQDVIKRRQVLLVQVVKEERGNKGAALTSYLSLAGRYCVLMPNTSHGGGISRKISNSADRKRLKSIIADLNLPGTMGCIVRTAGLSRTKTEIKRDFDYLARLWDEIRENTLRASAPALIHNDSDLIKRAIRDIYHREIEEVVVEGEEGYRLAKDFMKLLMPSHARRVKPYVDPVSLFQRYGVEDQLAAMYNPVVQLKSGGYLVINPTEALVSIDINSGRSTREHNIEQTAVSTNLEAAREIARQLRLRDMAGLVVIDFIDMEYNSNIRKVEKAMKEALKDDRARIQVGRISGFGLMEMSRQRLRTGVLEASTRACPHCEGTGLVRTASSAGLSALRMLEEESARGRGSIVTLRASQEAAFYVLNNKRRELDEIEQRYGVTIVILPDGEVEGARMSVEASGPRPVARMSFTPIIEDLDVDEPIEDEEDELDDEDDEETEQESAQQPRGEDREGGRGKRKRRRRGRRGRREGDERPAQSGEPSEGGGDDEAGEEEGEEGEDAGQELVEADGDAGGHADGDTGGEIGSDGQPRRSRRGRRGGRRRRGGNGQPGDAEAAAEPREATDGEAEPVLAPVSEAEPAAEPVETEEPRKARRRPRARKGDVVALAPEMTVPDMAVADAAMTPDAMTPDAMVPESAPVKVEADVVVAAKPARSRRKAAAPAVAAEDGEVAAKPKRSRRKAPAPEAEVPADAAPAPSAAPAPDAGIVAAEPVAMAMPEPSLAPEPESAPEQSAQVPAPEADSAPESAPAEASQEMADGDGDSTDQPRRGWWQRTFGN